MYAAYLKEREGLELLENEHGFATYKLRGPDVYIQDIYVRPEFRKAHVAARLADQIAALAKEQGYTILTGSVDEAAGGARASADVLVAYGMKPYTKEGSMTYYFKELS